ncbi:GFA family protein [uncultured Litoreibacter sp.]|uniref:GFA family protein n=1 Tax=uncultured Litoreibacter sp. TaxID=1392394 RepID=UPI0026235D83|nr:GFA family protein [uncultured Litoreibacter sp.]
MGLSGKCLCGAVSYTVTGEPTHLSACHCSMCRRWSGGVFLGMGAAPDAVTFKGEENLTIFTSSDWAERGFCKTCGANMFYRVTAPGQHQGVYHLGSGTLDDHGDLQLTEQLFIDIKPKGYGFADKTNDMTQAQVEAMFSDVS